MISKGWINEFCLNHSLKFQKINGDKSRQLFISNNKNQEEIYSAFLNFIKEKDKELNVMLGKKELVYLKNLLKATVAKNIWDAKAYYQILSEEDEFIQEAIKKLN